MTKKHFELIAKAMAQSSGQLGHKEACQALASALAGSNPRFDQTRFLAACGVIL
jgi:hypothetical protein